MKLRSMFIIFALGYALTVIYAKANDKQPFETVLNKLELASVIMGLDDYSSIGEPIVDLLNEDDTKTYKIELDGQRNHSILVVCDGDCDDVDVSLYTRNWTLIEEDDDDGDTGFLEGRTPYTGEYYLKIELPDCDADPCAVAAMAFKK